MEKETKIINGKKKEGEERKRMRKKGGREEPGRGKEGKKEDENKQVWKKGRKGCKNRKRRCNK